jgi:catechol 2,3-dioxygenase-like lactoylglutathione lyase family enzyme
VNNSEIPVVTPFSHVGLSVPDLTEAVRWYEDVLGFRLLDPPRRVDKSSPVAVMARDIYGERWGAMYQAHMSAANGVGLELFQFTEPRESQPDGRFEYWRPGLFHFAVTCPDVKGLAERIAAAGGRLRTSVYEPRPGFTMCYCEDPWGNALEVNSRSYELAHPVRAAG